MDNILKIFAVGYRPSALRSELSIISAVCKDGNPTHFDELLSILKILCTNERLLMKNIITIAKIMLANSATTATPKRSFTQQRFNALAVLNSNKSLVDKLPLANVASDFVDSPANRRNDFGVFRQEVLN